MIEITVIDHYAERDEFIKGFNDGIRQMFK